MKTRIATIFPILLMGVMVSCGDHENYHETFDGVSDPAETAGNEYTYYDSVEEMDEKEIFSEGDADPLFNTESYAHTVENDFMSPGTNPLSTFSIDVDNASYANCRRMIEDGYLPPVDAVRSEEFINYFDYNYPLPSEEEMFSVYTELGACPWNEEAELLHIGLKGYSIPTDELPPSNLVFLLDVSGSMEERNKLPLLQQSFKTLVHQLGENDRVSIVTYAGADRVVLESTSCANKALICEAIDNLKAGGSTNGEGGINKAYELAEQNLLVEGNNRIILATDGDFNIGQSSDGELTRLIEEKRELGVYLTILGYGMGNYKDSKMESLADHGNGNYFYIDDIRESNRVLVQNLAGTLHSIAKDVKIQVEFNPEEVKEYRLVGYENRLLNEQDFDDDTKDAGELGAGHTVTALYEIIRGKSEERSLQYQQASSKHSDDLATIGLRYKLPQSSESTKIQHTVSTQKRNEASADFDFAAAVAAYSLILRESKYIQEFNLEDVIRLAQEHVHVGEADKLEFLHLVESTKLLKQVEM